MHLLDSYLVLDQLVADLMFHSTLFTILFCSLFVEFTVVLQEIGVYYILISLIWMDSALIHFITLLSILVPAL